MLTVVSLQYWKWTLLAVGQILIARLSECVGGAALYENLTTSGGRTPVATTFTTAPQVPLAIASVGIATVPLAIFIAIVPLTFGTVKARFAVNIPLITLLYPPPV